MLWGSPSLRILIETFNLNPNGGGGPRYAHILAEWLLRQGHEVRVVGFAHDSNPPDYAIPLRRGKLSFNGLTWMVSLSSALRRQTAALLRSWKPDVVHTVDPFGAIMIRLPATRVVNTLHNPILLTWRELTTIQDRYGILVWHLHEKLAGKRAARVVFPTAAAGKAAARIHDIEPAKGVVIPNGLDFRSEFARKLNIIDRRNSTEGTLHLLCVSRLDAPKRVEDLIVALDILRRKGRTRPLDLTITGGGPMQQPLQDLVLQLGLSDIVRFVGGADDASLRSLYQRSDIFVLPSVVESFPYVLLEAMLSGLPTIACKVGGLPEVIQEGTTGFLAEPRNPTSIASCIEKVAESPDMAAALGRNARERVRKDFNMDVCGSRLVEIYGEAS